VSNDLIRCHFGLSGSGGGLNSTPFRSAATFVRTDALTGNGLSPEAVKKALQRLVRRGRIVKLKDYFFVLAVAIGIPKAICPSSCSCVNAPPPV
jgi:hypothetical protein